jgi:GDPmannose 4,6-dehydratase
MAKTALLTGITGQDGSYLSELLLRKRYTVYGLVLECDTAGVERLSCRDKVNLIEGDLKDQASIDCAVKTSEPDEIYNLAAPSFVASSFKNPLETAEIAALGALRLLESAKKGAPDARVFQASSAEIFGRATSSPQNEKTPLDPTSPYGIAKAFALMSSRLLREHDGMFVSNGIFYNHESPRRPPDFVTRKISLGVARIAFGLQRTIELGNLNAKRDWGYAPEYVDAAYRILQFERPEDFIIATGELHSVKEFLEEACEVAGIGNPHRISKIKKELIRPANSTRLRGDARKAKRLLGWEPKVKFKELVRIMVEADLKLAAEESRQKKK